MGTNLQRKNLRCCWSLSPLLIVPILRSFEEHSNKLMLFVILIIMVMEVFCAYRPTARFKAFHNIPWGIQFDTSVLVSIPLFQHPCLPPLSQKKTAESIAAFCTFRKGANFWEVPLSFFKAWFKVQCDILHFGWSPGDYLNAKTQNLTKNLEWEIQQTKT